MTKKGTGKSILSLAALTVFGNDAFTFKYSSQNGVDFISSLLIVIITVVTLLFTVKFTAFLKERIEGNQKLNLWWSATIFLAGAFCLIFAVLSLAELTQICRETLAEKQEAGFVILGLLLTTACFAASKQKVLLKFSLVLFPIVFGLLIVIFFFSSSYMSLKYLELKEMPQISIILSQTLKKFTRGILPAVLPLIVFCHKSPSSAVVGGAVGSAFILLTVANTLLIFGSSFASELQSPFAEAVGTVSLGELFSRMDVALYPVCFFSGIIRIAVQSMAAVKLFKKSKNIIKNVK